MTITKKLVLPANASGRDFVVGDVHGCYNEIVELLSHINFDSKVDRLFSVGDLVDRGKDSLKCLDLLSNPWFRATLGNHEDMLVKYTQNPLDQNNTVAWWQNGGKWAIDLNSYGGPQPVEFETLKLYAQVIEKLMPLVIVVGEGAQRFNIVHAEFRSFGKVLSDRTIDVWDFTFQEEYSMLWGRSLIGGNYSSLYEQLNPQEVNGLSRTFVGHSPTLQIIHKKGHYFIDTGCVYTVERPGVNTGAGLTIVNANTNEYITYHPYYPTEDHFTPWTLLPPAFDL